MIETSKISLRYINKLEYTGGFQGMRYMFCKEGDLLAVYAWPEPFCFVKTPEEKKQKNNFSFTDEGKEEAVKWLNDWYQKNYS